MFPVYQGDQQVQVPNFALHEVFMSTFTLTVVVVAAVVTIMATLLGRRRPVKKESQKRRGRGEDLDLGFLIKGVERSSDEVSSCERPHYGVHPKEWDVATLFLPLADDKSQHSETYSGPSNHESDCEEGDHSEWSFGPSFSSGMIISRARQLMNL